jgi:hypothetical protein
MVASSPTSHHGPDMGSVTTSHIGGGAVWWKSPSTALVRGRDGQPPDLLYITVVYVGIGFKGTLQESFFRYGVDSWYKSTMTRRRHRHAT